MFQAQAYILDFKDKLNIKEAEYPTRHPANNYIKTKIMAENVIDSAFNDRLDVITIRPRGIYGSGDSAILPRLLKSKQRKIYPENKEDDIFNRHNSYVENVVEAMILAMNAPKNIVVKNTTLQMTKIFICIKHWKIS